MSKLTRRAALSKGGGVPAGYDYAIRSNADIERISGTVQDGYKIWVAPGVYTKMLDLSGDDLVVDGSGIGVTVFDCSDVIPANSFSLASGQAKTYQASVSLMAGVKNKGNIWVGDDFFTLVTSAPTDVSPAGTAHVSDWTSSSPTVTIRPYGDTDPRVDGKLYRISARHSGVNIVGARPMVSKFTAKRNLHQDGSVRLPGDDPYLSRVRVEDGCRHAMLIGVGAVLEDCEGYRARNDLESPYTANLIVCNRNLVAGETFTTRRCTWDGGDQPFVTAYSNHGGDPDEKFATCLHEDCTFINLSQVATAKADSYIIRRGTFVNCGLGASPDTDDVGLTFEDCEGELNQVLKNGSSAAGSDAKTGLTFIDRRNTWKPKLLAVGLWRADGTTGTGNTYTIEDATILSNVATSGVGDLIRIASGLVYLRRLNIGPNLGAKITNLVRLGFNSGTVALDSDANRWAYALPYIYNGTTYGTLAAFKAATGQDSTSNSTGDGGEPSGETIYTLDPSAMSDQNLEDVTGITRIGGAAAQAAIRSGKIAIIGTTQTAYAVPDLESANHVVDFKVSQVPASAGPFPIVVRLIDQSNGIGIRWNSSQYQIWKLVGGLLTSLTPGSGTLVPQVGDVCKVIAVGDRVTLYVNEAAHPSIKDLAYSASELDAATKAGMIARTSTLNPSIDYIIAGTL